jgi:nucleoid-associated protein YgaU
MRRARVLLVLLLIAGWVGAYYASHNGWQLPQVPSVGGSGTKPAETRPSGAQQAQSSDVTRPTFDIVRADPSGDLVMAGRAEPGWAVTVESNGRVVGSSMADANGEWIIQPSAPIGKGEHSLQLKAQSPKGGQMLFSKQALALSMGDATKSRPLVALTEDGAATRVLQMSPSPAPADAPRSAALTAVPAPAPAPAAKGEATGNIQPATPSKQQDPVTPKPVAASQVSFTSIDYEQAEGRNMVFLSGRGTPGSRLMLYIDNEFAGMATIDATGSWTFKAARELAGGSHMLRADSIDFSDTNKVLARAEVNFDRQAPKAIAAVGSGLPPVAPQPPRQPVVAENSPAASAAGTSEWRSAGTSPAVSEARPPIPTDSNGVIIIRRGDTLWQIAQRHLGSGSRYTQIFQNNRDQIRNPDRIYPNQKFTVPR